MFKNYIDPIEGEKAKKKLPQLMVEGLLLGGTGLGVLALIFEIAADAFSVAAYQTLLAIHGADGQHTVAIAAFIALSIMLFVGIVPAYKAGAYLKPNAGGSGPLVEAIGPPQMRWLSWVGTSLFFLDAVLTIIISSISASDVTMLVMPQLASYRLILAEVFAFFIMVVLVLMGPKKAVPLFLLGGAAFTIFTIAALAMVSLTAAGNAEWAFLTDGIVTRLQMDGIVSEVVRAETVVLSTALIFKLFFASMSSAMLGFSGYEVIPASGKHAARPKWKVINTALTLAAIFLIGTGMMQLYAAKQWDIPATEGYSTLLIEYEIDAVQLMSNGRLNADSIKVTGDDTVHAQEFIAEQEAEHGAEHAEGMALDEVAFDIAVARTIKEVMPDNSAGGVFLFVAGSLLAVILLLAQGGGYIGGAAVAANASRLGRLPKFFLNDRIGIGIIWAVSATLIPIIREVVVVEAYYAFGFVSAFVITSTTVVFVRDDVLIKRGITPGSAEAKSLKFAGVRGMIASYFMMIVLVTQKTSALPVIIVGGLLITVFQLYYANGGFKRKTGKTAPHLAIVPGVLPSHVNGLQRAHDKARQHGIVDALEELLAAPGFVVKFNLAPDRIRKLVGYLYNISPKLLFPEGDDHHGRIEEPSVDLEETYRNAYDHKDELARRIEEYSHTGIFMFIHNYHANLINEENGRDARFVQQAMINALFPLIDDAIIWKEYRDFKAERQPEEVWQFCRQRYLWAKNQWPNLSGRIVTIWTLQDFGLIPMDIDVTTVVTVEDGRERMAVNFSGILEEDE